MRSRIDGPVLLPLIPLLREYSCSLVFSTANLSLTSELLRSQMYTTAVLPLANSTDIAETSRTLGLTPAQRAYAENKLTLGQVIVRSGKWGAPILATFPPLPYTKHVSPADWHAAIERTNALAPKKLALGPTKVTDATPQPNASSPNRIALNRTEMALLEYIAREGITIVSEAYNGIGAHYQVAHRAKEKLILLGLIDAEAITTRSGRGGRSISLRATKEGRERVGMTPPKGTRGGDCAQHYWAVRQLQKYLPVPEANVEVLVGQKSIDILLKTDPSVHDHFFLALNELGYTFNGSISSIAPNTLIAIEVEVSDPLRTAPNNITKDLEAGIAKIILAVMPTDLKIVMAKLPSLLTQAQLDSVTVIDALLLLDALRGAGGRESS